MKQDGSNSKDCGLYTGFLQVIFPSFIHPLFIFYFFKILHVFIVCHVQSFYFFSLIPHFLNFFMSSSISLFSAFLLRGATTENQVTIFELLNWLKHQ